MALRACVLLLLVSALDLTAWAGDIEGKVTGMKGKSVVYLDTIAGKTFPAPKDHPVMDQKGLMFAPHILVVQQGTTVEFLNSDTVQHNAFWTAINGDKKAGHNLGTWPKGEKRPFTFAKPGVVPVLCNVHPEMAGYIIVSPTPYFAETDDSGNFKIKDVPDGSYTVTAWHEGAKNQSKPVMVSGGGKADFTLTK
ncbi:MAG TPA: carboxypeptidase regulatory-like domain-containing protein [Candidatus Sulfotelmatobacter sp.]|jgi:plastocyanin|nr:carboxypeptidase regulatory-like domain-containing protein [Candidatus Sulfotelmatobacter sp.]